MELVQVNVLEVILPSRRLKKTTPEQPGNHAWNSAKKMKIVPASLTKDPEHTPQNMTPTKEVIHGMRSIIMVSISTVPELLTTQNAYSILEQE